jgi:hypothetical protein
MIGLSIDAAAPGTPGTAPAEPRDPTSTRSRRRRAGPDGESAVGTTGFERAMRQESDQVARQIEAGPTAPGTTAATDEAVPGRAGATRPQGEVNGAEPTGRTGADDRTSRLRLGNGKRTAPEPDAGALLNAAAAAAGLGGHATPPRTASSSPGEQIGALDGDRGAAASTRNGEGVEAAEQPSGPPQVEERRRPTQELIGLVPGRKEAALPSSTPSEASLNGGTHAAPRAVSGATLASATTSGHAVDLRPLEGSGVDGAILQSAAHLRIEGAPGGAGDVELHLRVRGDVTHVRIDGEVGRVAAVHAPELANALASVGLSLGRLETPPVASASPASSSNGFGHRSGSDPGTGQSHSQPQGQPEPDPGGPPGPPRPQAASHHPSGRQPARGARVHVKA